MGIGLVTAFGASVPQPLTSLVGRAAAVALVRSRLQQTGVRLRTLTGPPGAAITFEIGGAPATASPALTFQSLGVATMHLTTQR